MAVTIDQKRQKQIKQYFEGKMRWLPLFLILIGIPLLFAFFIGVIPIILGIVLMVRGGSGLIADAKVDEWTDEAWKSHDFIGRAREISGFQGLVREPILLRSGSAAGVLSRDVVSGERIGDDGYHRATPISATVILATDEQLGIYRTGLDLITGNRVNEQFLEVFYQDVISVSTGDQVYTRDIEEAFKNAKTTKFSADELAKGLSRKKVQQNLDRWKKKYADSMVAGLIQYVDARFYQIDFADGEKITIPVSDMRSVQQANRAPFIDGADETAKAMHALRMFVREKKRGFLRKEIAG